MSLAVSALCRRACSLRCIVGATGALIVATTLLGSSITSIPLVPSEGVENIAYIRRPGEEVIQYRCCDTRESPGSNAPFIAMLQRLQSAEKPLNPSIWNRIITYFQKHPDEEDGAKLTVHLLVEGWLELANEELQALNAKEAELAWYISTREGVCCSGRRLLRGDVAAERAYAQQLSQRRTSWRRGHCERATVLLTTISRLLRPRQRRQFQLLCRGPQYSPQESANYATLIGKLQQVYTSAKVCHAGRCYHGEEEVDRAMQVSRRPKFLEWAWRAWRDAVGKPARPLFRILVPIMNSAARRNNYSDMGECWREELDTPKLEEEVFRMYEQVEPMYIMLHAVVRHHLANYYGDSVVDRKGLIPAHLLGNMWAQNWAALTDMVLPSASRFDIGRAMRKRGATVLTMVRTAEDLFVSMGLPRMPDSFWDKSRFRRTSRGNVNCHGTAANMFHGRDYRMLYCAQVSREDYEVIHHEMGHIEYYMAYEHQPAIFREGATSAVQEAVGDAMSLAATVPQQLQRLSLTNDSAPQDGQSPLLTILSLTLLIVLRMISTRFVHVRRAPRRAREPRRN